MQSQSECLHQISCAVLLCTSPMMANCGLTADGPGAVFVDPGMYDGYHCDDLIRRWKVLIARQEDLKNLIDKPMRVRRRRNWISRLSGNYDSVLTEKILVQRRAADLKCSITPGYKSDDAIR